jgi:hypothetical protein
MQLSGVAPPQLPGLDVGEVFSARKGRSTDALDGHLVAEQVVGTVARRASHLITRSRGWAGVAQVWPLQAARQSRSRRRDRACTAREVVWLMRSKTTAEHRSSHTAPLPYAARVQRPDAATEPEPTQPLTDRPNCDHPGEDVRQYVHRCLVGIHPPAEFGEIKRPPGGRRQHECRAASSVGRPSSVGHR